MNLDELIEKVEKLNEEFESKWTHYSVGFSDALTSILIELHYLKKQKYQLLSPEDLQEYQERISSIYKGEYEV